MKDVEPEKHSSVIDSRHAGLFLIDYLARRYTYLSRETWYGEIGAGRIALNGRPCNGSEALVRGDTVTYSPPAREEPEVTVDYTILFEDDDFLLVDKPPNLPCHPSGMYRANTLLSLLRARFPAIRLVNRLDRETSGVLVAAKSAEAAARACAAFAGTVASCASANEGIATGSVMKEYLVLVEGAFPGKLDARGWLGPDTASPVRKKIAFSSEKGDVACETSFELVGRYVFDDGSEGSLVRAVPVTGRTHQIRATARSLGFPVVGDKLYGPDDGIYLRFVEGTMTEDDRRALRMPHHALHCLRTTLALGDGLILSAEAPLPLTWPSGISPLLERSYRPAGG